LDFETLSEISFEQNDSNHVLLENEIFLTIICDNSLKNLISFDDEIPLDQIPLDQGDKDDNNHLSSFDDEISLDQNEDEISLDQSDNNHDFFPQSDNNRLISFENEIRHVQSDDNHVSVDQSDKSENEIVLRSLTILCGIFLKIQA
jgi:hypothetical protein